jgi:hypothetical protein
MQMKLLADDIASHLNLYASKDVWVHVWFEEVHALRHIYTALGLDWQQMLLNGPYSVRRYVLWTLFPMACGCCRALFLSLQSEL